MPRLRWTPEMLNLVRVYYPPHGAKITTAIIKNIFPSFPYSRKEVMVKASRIGVAGNHISRGQFQKGKESPFKGKKLSDYQYEKAAPNMFKKGRKPKNTLPIGTISLQKNGYYYIKIAAGKWIHYHLHLWTTNNGPVPEKYRIWYKDNDRSNCTLENLVCTSVSEMLLAKRKLRNLKLTIK